MTSNKIFLAMFLAALPAGAASPIKVLIVDGRNNHKWQETTPVMKKALEQTGLFQVDVATAPPGTDVMPGFRPRFSDYAAVVDNFTDYPKPGTWSEETMLDFVAYVRKGGGVVPIHAACSGFGGWKEFEEIMGLAGWAGRTEKTGPYIRFRDGRFVRDMSPGPAGHHGKQHAFKLETRDARHPIMAGLPAAWLHATDELYDRLRGPARNMTVLATTFSDPAQGGTGENEPMLFTVRYGKGRVFHTVLGHGAAAMQCAGFQVTLQRGVEWAATGRVTQKVPADFPTADQVRLRP